MKNSTTIIITIISLLIIGGGVVYIIDNQSTTTSREVESSQNEDSAEPDDIAEPTSQTNNDSSGEYIDYSEQAFVDAADQTRLLFFHASWCPQCRALEADIAANGVPEDVTIFEVDFDNSQQLRQKYGVTTQTTVVKVDADGELVDSFVPFDDPSIANVSARLL